jgi:hypothetical protein
MNLLHMHRAARINIIMHLDFFKADRRSKKHDQKLLLLNKVTGVGLKGRTRLDRHGKWYGCRGINEYEYKDRGWYKELLN